MVVKGVLKLPSLHMLLTKKSQPLHRTFACRTFGVLLIVLSIQSMTRTCCLLHLIKQNYLLRTFLKILILMTDNSLPVCSVRTNLKLHSITTTLKMV